MTATRGPAPTGSPEEVFWGFAAQGRLALQRCAECGSWRWPPREVCHACLGARATWEPIHGTGTVVSFVTVRSTGGAARRAPYSVVHVELDEGVRYTANIFDVEPEQVRVGMRVRLVLETSADGTPLPQFRAAPEG